MNRDMTEIIITIIVCVTILCMCIGSNYFDYKLKKLKLESTSSAKVIENQEGKILPKSEDTDWFQEACKIIPRK